MTPLSLSLPNQFFGKSIQYFVTNLSISSNTNTKLVFPSHGFLDNFLKSFQTFATSDMDDHKEISSRDSIDFDESTKRYAHSSGVQKSQTTPKNACKDDGAKLFLANIYPLRPCPEASNHLSSVLVTLIFTRETLCICWKQIFLLRANYCQANTST